MSADHFRPQGKQINRTDVAKQKQPPKSGNRKYPFKRDGITRPEKIVSPTELLNARIKNTDDYPIVEIEWEDAVSVGGYDWVNDEDIDVHASKSYSLGYLVSETDDAMTVVALVNDSHYAHGITIPKGMITVVRKIA
jgi:hypothetical protein